MKLSSLLVALFIYTNSSLCFAQYFTGAVAEGTGGAGRAANEPGEALHLNPALLPHAPDFSMSVFYVDGNLYEGSHDTNIGVSLVDNNEEAIFPGGISYFQRRRNFEGIGGVDEEYYYVAAGNFVVQQLALGFSAMRLVSQIDQPNGKEYEQWSGTAGLHWNPHPDLGMGLIWYHFVPPKSEVPEQLRLIPSVAFGTTYIINKFIRYRLDVSQLHKHNPDRKLRWQSGFESYLGQFFILRFGGDIDGQADQNFYTLGFTLNLPKFKIDYSFRQNTDDTEGALHSVDLRAPF